MTDDEKATAVARAVKAATALKPMFTGTSDQRERLWRLAVWDALDPDFRISLNVADPPPKGEDSP